MFPVYSTFYYKSNFFPISVPLLFFSSGSRILCPLNTTQSLNFNFLALPFVNNFLYIPVGLNQSSQLIYFIFPKWGVNSMRMHPFPSPQCWAIAHTAHRNGSINICRLLLNECLGKWTNTFHTFLFLSRKPDKMIELQPWSQKRCRRHLAPNLAVVRFKQNKTSKTPIRFSKLQSKDSAG